MEYVVKSRYQYRSRDGIVWSDWFVCDNKHVDEKDIKDVLKQYKESSVHTDKITKLKHEFDIMDADIYEQEYKEFLDSVEAAKKDFATIKKIKKPWQAAARKERKKLAEMSNDEKLQYLARKRSKNKN